MTVAGIIGSNILCSLSLSIATVLYRAVLKHCTINFNINFISANTTITIGVKVASSAMQVHYCMPAYQPSVANNAHRMGL